MGPPAHCWKHPGLWSNWARPQPNDITSGRLAESKETKRTTKDRCARHVKPDPRRHQQPKGLISEQLRKFVGPSQNGRRGHVWGILSLPYDHVLTAITSSNRVKADLTAAGTGDILFDPYP